MTQKRKTYCLICRVDIKEGIPHWATRVELKNILLLQTPQEMIWMLTKTGNAPILGLQSQQQLIQNAESGLEKSLKKFCCSYYVLENLSETCTTDRRYKKEIKQKDCILIPIN